MSTARYLNKTLKVAVQHYNNHKVFSNSANSFYANIALVKIECNCVRRLNTYITEPFAGDK